MAPLVLFAPGLSGNEETQFIVAGAYSTKKCFY